MTARPIEWHKECLLNWRAAIAEQQRAIDQKTAAIERSQTDAAFLERQIAHAEGKGMSAFDSERLLVRKKA